MNPAVLISRMRSPQYEFTAWDLALNGLEVFRLGPLTKKELKTDMMTNHCKAKTST